MIIRFGRLRTTLHRFRQDDLDYPGVLADLAGQRERFVDGVTVARSIVRPSALETIFCAITTTSRSRKLCPARSQAGRYQRGQIVPGPHHRQTGDRRKFPAASCWLIFQPIEALAQFRQHQLAIEFQEPGLIRAGRMEHQMAETHVDIGLDLLDVLVWIGWRRSSGWRRARSAAHRPAAPFPSDRARVIFSSGVKAKAAQCRVSSSARCLSVSNETFISIIRS